MKKIIMFLAFFSMLWMMTLRADAPPFEVIYLPAGQMLCTYNIDDQWLRWTMNYESRFKYWAVNKHSKARGSMQITEVMIREVNKIISRYEKVLISQGYYSTRLRRYIWNDAYNVDRSIEIWWIVQGYHNPGYYRDKACRIWFGTGKQYDGMRWEDYYNGIIELNSPVIPAKSNYLSSELINKSP